MATPVLIMGRSGTGKSTSMMMCTNNPKWNLVKVLNKPLPFRGKIPTMVSDDYQTIMKAIYTSKADSIVIDDAGYLITNYFMKNHSTQGKGNDIFSMYNTLADNFWHLIQFINQKLPDQKIVYVVMHEDKDETGDVKPKTIGKLLDEKVCLEGMFSIVLRCVIRDGKHLFVTQYDEGAVSKSPIGMFEDLEIPNELFTVDKTIREYYGLWGAAETMENYYGLTGNKEKENE